MFSSSIQENLDPFVAELIEFSSQAAMKKQALRSLTQTRSQGTIDWNGRRQPEQEHADPLMPLRDRDIEVLLELFEQEQIEEIEADVIHNLLMRWPEPCWEDEPSDFLQDYL